MSRYDKEVRSRSYYEGRAPRYDWANRIASALRGVSGIKERRKAVDRLQLAPGQRVLEVSVGTGTNVHLIREALGREGRAVGLDISRSMLAQCRRKLERQGVQADLTEGEAAHLPFADAAFDAVFHHGGIAEFGDKQGAIEEMMRVARPAARIVLCDVGLPTDRRLPLMSRLLLKFQPEYEQPPPLDLIPARAQDVQVDWFHGGSWYLITFVNP
jgi:ubiquinone/menaquinone biosynthesis C-methylase UbiE